MSSTMPGPSTRRSFLTRTVVAGGGLVGAGLPHPARAGDPYGFGPDWSRNWVAHGVSQLASVTQYGADAIAVDTPAREDQLDDGQVAIWARQPVSGDFRFDFSILVTNRVASPAGSFATFYFDTRGEGSAAYPADMTRWSGIAPTDALYNQHARGLRFSFATYNPTSPDQERRLRLRYFELSPANALVGAPSPQRFPFDTGIAWRVTVERRSRALVVGARRSDGAGRKYGWADARIDHFGSGQIGLRWRGQDCLLYKPSLQPLR